MDTGYRNQNWDVIQFGAFPSVNPSVYIKTESSLKIKYDESPLGNACSQGKLEIVKRLIDEGTEIDQKDYLNLTPIVRAASNGHRNVVEFLVKRGARISYALLTTVKTRIDALEENAKSGREDPYLVERWKKFLDYLILEGKKQ